MKLPLTGLAVGHALASGIVWVCAKLIVSCPPSVPELIAPLKNLAVPELAFKSGIVAPLYGLSESAKDPDNVWPLHSIHPSGSSGVA